MLTDLNNTKFHYINPYATLANKTRDHLKWAIKIAKTLSTWGLLSGYISQQLKKSAF